MKLDERFDVSPRKVEELLERIRELSIDPADIQESFVHGGGPGGQSVNKTANCVMLRYPLLSIVVRCQRERSRTVNRFLALRELVDRIEEKARPNQSRRAHEIRRRRRNKARSRKRSQAKHQPKSDSDE